jgi:dynein heavy chain, axonemal
VIARYEIPAEREELEQIDNLRYTWQRLVKRALDVHCLLLSMQPRFEHDLRNNLQRFRLDNVQYCHEYRTSGPMMPGLTPREASDKLIVFQVQMKTFIFMKY